MCETRRRRINREKRTEEAWRNSIPHPNRPARPDEGGRRNQHPYRMNGPWPGGKEPHRNRWLMMILLTRRTDRGPHQLNHDMDSWYQTCRSQSLEWITNFCVCRTKALSSSSPLDTRMPCSRPAIVVEQDFDLAAPEYYWANKCTRGLKISLSPPLRWTSSCSNFCKKLPIERSTLPHIFLEK